MRYRTEEEQRASKGGWAMMWEWMEGRWRAREGGAYRLGMGGDFGVIGLGSSTQIELTVRVRWDVSDASRYLFII